MRQNDRAAPYLARDWSVFELAAGDHFRTLRQTHGACAMIELGDELRRHAVQQRSNWPTAIDRARDLANHRKLIELIDRVDARRR
jgi:hypothetical protein